MLQPFDRLAGMCEPRRPSRSGGVRTVILSALALLSVAACSADTDRATDVPELARPQAEQPAGDPSTEAITPGVRAKAIATVQEQAGEEYHLEAAADGRSAVAHNAACGFAARWDDGALLVEPSSLAPAWRLELAWTGLGRGADVDGVPKPISAEVEGNRVTQRQRDGSEEWFLNGPLGIEHGFVLSERPAGEEGRLVVQLSVTGGLRPIRVVEGAEVALVDETGTTVLRYTDLVAKDARGVWLEASMDTAAGGIQLVIDDREASYPVSIDPLVWAEQQKLVAGDGADNDRFGLAVSVSGSTAIVGAPYAAGGGAAYVFGRDEGGLDNWGQVTKLVWSDAAAGALFGYAVAISGDSAMVGAPGASGTGAAYAFRRHSGGVNNWGQVERLTASDAQGGDQYGAAVALSGDRGIVGAPLEDGGGTDRGAAYIVARESSGGDSWSEVTKITATGAADSDLFGSAVALAADTAIVGAPQQDGAGSNRGAAYVFQADQGGTDQWGQVTQVAAGDPENDAAFGAAVAASGDLALVGAPLEDGGGTNRGAAYLFNRNSGGTNHWGQIAKLTASDAGNSDELGGSVSLSGDAAIVGAKLEEGAGTDQGAAYVFERNQGGADQWGELVKLLASDGEDDDQFGSAVGVSQDSAIIAASDEDGAGTDRGAAYAFAMRLTNGEPCDSGRECLSLHCVDAVCCDDECGGGDPTDCMACTVSGGSTEEGLCAVRTDGSTCDDGTFCNGQETCTGGVCGNSPGDPCAAFVGNLDNDCSQSCDEAADSCTADDPDGSTCTDGVACNGADQCENGECSVHETTCPPDPGSTPPGADEDDDGCGCRQPARSQSVSGAAGFVLLGLGLMWMRRRRTSAACQPRGACRRARAGGRE